MTKLFVYLVLALSVCSVNFAQTNEVSPCPTIDVTGPTKTVQPDELITFTAALSKEAEKFNPRFKWTASNGEIIEGQETLTVKVLHKDILKGLTATFGIIGLPKECHNTLSASVFIGFAPEALKFTEFSVPVSRIEKSRLDNLSLKLNNSPGITAFIIERFDKNTSTQAISRKNKLITDYLKSNRIGTDRFVLLNDLSDENLTQFFITYQGVAPPKCSSCITVELK
ncbi:MAG TPA: hypothetical protein VK308_05455 [Pyrinomonadaceae bacterium]|nr:hypothetical protein [Pyrinomonadaceae bacterium]